MLYIAHERGSNNGRGRKCSTDRRENHLICRCRPISEVVACRVPQSLTTLFAASTNRCFGKFGVRNCWKRAKPMLRILLVYSFGILNINHKLHPRLSYLVCIHRYCMIPRIVTCKTANINRTTLQSLVKSDGLALTLLFTFCFSQFGLNS